MRAGQRNRRITIEQRTVAPNAVGDHVETWSVFKTAWAKVETQSGQEFERAKELHSEMTHLLGTRYISGVNSKMRVILGGSTLDIISVFDPHQKREELRFVCNEQA